MRMGLILIFVSWCLAIAAIGYSMRFVGAEVGSSFAPIVDALKGANQ
jgi:hypothetical protein